MPGWHVKTKELRDQGKIRMVGIIEEQHPDRARLFMKWKQMDWPLMVDSLNLLRMTAVPVTLLIDERGNLRGIRPNEAEVKAFVETEFKPAGATEERRSGKPALERLRREAESKRVESLREFARAAFLWGEDASLEETIQAYREAVDLDPEDGATHFRLGVAHRKRYDSNDRVDGDFEAAVEHWGRALAIDPNQYIWRRRIQQYGPRLDKPYPFYDWVITAREDIRKRGEEPPALVVEPSGAEIASPSKEITSIQKEVPNPDPEARITRDSEGFLRVETTVVPSRMKTGEAVRVHVEFTPNDGIKAHWNNEADDLAFWIDPPAGWAVSGRHHTVPNPREPVDKEPRRIEFELKSPQDIAAGEVTVPCFALYYVCEDVNGVCVYRRREVPVTVAVE